MSERTSLVPHLVVSNAATAIDFYKKAFGATEIGRHVAPDSNKIMHAALDINGGRLFVNDDFSEAFGQKPTTPDALGGSPVTLHLQVNDAKAVWAKAVDAGAQVVFPLQDQFWGDRYGQLRDPFGHKWSIGQTIAMPTTEELEKGAKASMRHAKEHAHA